MHIISAADFSLFCSNSARKCLIMPAECSPQKSLIILKILPAEFIQAYCLEPKRKADCGFNSGFNSGALEGCDGSLETYLFCLGGLEPSIFRLEP